jgi:hypothetical protein
MEAADLTALVKLTHYPPPVRADAVIQPIYCPA